MRAQALKAEPMEQSIKTDLVVVGGGLAGFAAAFEAAGCGAQVVLLEKLAATGGSSEMSGGFFAFAGTDLQRQAGIEDSAELLFNDLREVGQFENDESVVQAYVDGQLATFEWLRSQDIRFSPIIEAFSGQSARRSHATDPADMMRALAARAGKTPAIKVLTATRAMRLFREPQSLRVEGLLAKGPQGPLKIWATQGVVLASGGFTRDTELIHRFAPNCDNAMFTGGEQNVGDGLRMGWALGADVRDTAYIKATYGKHPGENTTLHSCLAIYKGAIAVNQEGKRYVDESVSYKLLGDACLRQSYGATYQILDQGIFDTGDDRVHIVDFGRRREQGHFLESDTLTGLARMIEVPPGVLEQTVAEYNSYVDAGHDAGFGRKHLVHNFGELRRIDRPPFYAYPSTAIVFATYCGLRVDAGMRVIDIFGERIDGLLAAGEVMGGFHGAAYMTGTGLGKAAVFGRLAAQTALA